MSKPRPHIRTAPPKSTFVKQNRRQLKLWFEGAETIYVDGQRMIGGLGGLVDYSVYLAPEHGDDEVYFIVDDTIDVFRSRSDFDNRTLYILDNTKTGPIEDRTWFKLTRTKSVFF